ncbi:hypothetical protein BX616_003806 [Lobosporangium transversale]|nr:hypothetical protein BX616_003806 [Lobosporangium transversale]
MLVVENSAYDLSSTTAVKWCAFYPDCKHRIDEVTKGFRVTLTYDLLYLDLPEPAPYHDQLYTTLEKAMLKLHARHPGHVIGIGLANKYPTPSQQNSGHKVKPILKGRDLKVVTILHSFGYTTDIKAVFKVNARNISNYDGVESDAFPEDIYQVSELTEEEQENGEEIHVLSDVWDGWIRKFSEEYECAIDKLYKYSGRCIGNLVWLSKPKLWHAGPPYIAYGNEASLGFVYRDGCILAYKQDETSGLSS